MLKSYVKRAGRYTTAQKKAYDSLSSQYLIPFSEEKIDFCSVFKNQKVIIEIGFGSGFATAEIAQVNPDNNYLGIEVHKPGIGRLLWEIEKRCLSNVKIIEYDAAFVLEKMIPLCSVDAIHVFFPDPWPKKKHHKRRLMQLPFTQLLADSLKENGYLYMVTDWEDYANQTLEELTITKGLKNKYNGFADPQNWRPKTRFENKGLNKGHVIRELFFIKS